MLVADVLRTKGNTVFATPPTDTVAAVAALLFARQVGALMVVDDFDRVVGVVTERDIVRVIAREGGAGLHRPIAEFMTREVIYTTPSESIDALLAKMTDRRFRHAPVCEADQLLGVVSIGDLVAHKIAEAQAEAEGLRAYIHAA